MEQFLALARRWFSIRPKMQLNSVSAANSESDAVSERTGQILLLPAGLIYECHPSWRCCGVQSVQTKDVYPNFAECGAWGGIRLHWHVPLIWAALGAFQSLRAQSRAWLVLGTGPAACPSSLGHSVCAILFVFVLPWCFLALLSLLNKANLLVVCVRREHPLTQSPSWVSGEEGRVIFGFNH